MFSLVIVVSGSWINESNDSVTTMPSPVIILSWTSNCFDLRKSIVYTEASSCLQLKGTISFTVLCRWFSYDHRKWYRLLRGIKTYISDILYLLLPDYPYYYEPSAPRSPVLPVQVPSSSAIDRNSYGKCCDSALTGEYLFLYSLD